ncbi:MAG TPA: ATP-binding protein [Methylomirabilota bacterium]|nr:ATP-binding protein [Methylomirabilota bacterium]
MRNLNLLLVEDSEDDADLMLLELRRGGYRADYVRVDNAEDMLAALQQRKWDLVISDYVMPQFSGPAAMKLLQDSAYDIPIIIVSGHIGEDIAVSAMKSGANDYVMKDRLARLVPSVERELREAEVRRGRKAADEALRESEMRLKLALEAGRLGTWQRNLKTGAMTWSQITQEIYGLKPGEFSGAFKEFESLVHLEDRERVLDAITRAITGRGPYQVEFRIIRPNGALAWLESRGQIFIGADGQPERFTGVTVDVTARKRIEFNQEFLVEFSDRMRPLGNPSEVLRVAVNSVGEFLRVSRCLCAEVMTESSEIIVFRNYRDGVDELDGIYSFSDIKLPLMNSVLAGEAVVVDDTMTDPSTAPAYEAFFAPRQIRAFIIVPYIEEGILVWTMAVTAGPERRAWAQDEVELLRLVTERTWMAQKNARLYEAAQLARDEAEAASRAKDQFLAVLSHELRTPLTPVLMSTYTLQADPNLPAKMRSAVEMIQRNIQLEARLIDDLLDLSRITHNKVELQLADIDVHDVVRNAVDVCRSDIDGKQQQLVLELDARHHSVRGDAARLQQVFWNLLKNAAKFTPPGGRLSLQSYNYKGTVRIDVTDSGMGIDKHLLPKIFAPFEQGGGASFSAKFGGLGLGLAISKATIDAHGGRLTAQSEGKNAGAVFTVELPTIPRANGQPVTIHEKQHAA